MALIGNLSGSLTKTAAGKSFIRAGSNITITSGSVESSENVIVISSTGGLTGIDDQSSSNDDQITITDTAVIVNEDSDNLDFRVETNGQTHALFVDGGDDAVTLFSSEAERPTNAIFFVSGAKSGTGSTYPEVKPAVFGGDTVVSGNIYGLGTVFGAAITATTLAASTTVTAATNALVGADIIHVGDTDTKIGFTDDQRIDTVGGVEMVRYVEDGSQDLVEFNNAEADVDFIVNNTNDEAMAITAGGVVFNEDGHATNDFRVEGDAHSHMVFVDAGADELLLASDSATPTGFGADVTLFISGAKSSATSGGKGAGYAGVGAASGVTVVGGDLVVSGVLFGGLGSTDAAVAAGMNELNLAAHVITVGTKPPAAWPGNNVSTFISGTNAEYYSAENQLKAGTVLINGHMALSGAAVPAVDNLYNLGDEDYRWANIYTGDLHLKNDRGDWTMIEEPTYLSLRNNANGKVYRLLMEEIED